MENEALSLSRRLVGRDLYLSGVVRVAAPGALLTVLMPHLCAFSRHYPEIQLELAISNNYSNLTRREADIAVRVTRSPPDELTSDLWLLTHPDLRRTARVKVLMNFLAEALEKEKDLIEGRL